MSTQRSSFIRQPLGTSVNKSKENSINSDEYSNNEGLKLQSIIKFGAESQVCLSCKGQDEYVKVLQDALKEVLDQNEGFRKRLIELEALITRLEDEVDEKNLLIVQLQTLLRPKRQSKNPSK